MATMLKCRRCGRSFTADSQGADVLCSSCRGQPIGERTITAQPDLPQAKALEADTVVTPLPVPKSGTPTSAAMELRPEQVIGKCRIIRELGRGGMGAVYLAHHLTLDVPVAIKILPAHFAAKNPQFAERFIREGKLAARLNHPHIVAVRDADRDPDTGLYYLILEYIDGGTVRDLIKHGPLPVAEALRIIEEIAEALIAAHEHGVVHRDIKPDNIMLTRKGQAKLADLGLAKEVAAGGAQMTLSEVVMGTPAYMSPEQAQDSKRVDIRSDIYSLGAAFYHMLVGQTPYEADTTVNLLLKIVQEPLPDPRTRRPDLPEAVANLCMRMMAKRPEDRPQTPSDLLAEIKRAKAVLEKEMPATQAAAPSPLPTAAAAPRFAPVPPMPAPACAPPPAGSSLTWLAAGGAAAAVLLLLAGGVVAALFFFFGWRPFSNDSATSANANITDASATGLITQPTSTATPVRQTRASGEHTVDRFGISFIWIAPGDYGPQGIPGWQGKGMRISKGFWISEREIPWSLILQFASDLEKLMPAGKKGEDPVSHISWEDAKRFCEILTAAAGVRYRLPTEAEWEFAASAGGTQYPTAALRPGAANAWGLVDVADGLWEWCEDTYERQPFYASAIDPLCTSRGQFRVIRGGADYSGKYGGAIKARHYQDAKARLASVSLRLVREEEIVSEEKEDLRGLLQNQKQNQQPVLAEQMPSDPILPAAQPATPEPKP